MPPYWSLRPAILSFRKKSLYWVLLVIPSPLYSATWDFTTSLPKHLSFFCFHTKNSVTPPLLFFSRQLLLFDRKGCAKLVHYFLTRTSRFSTFVSRTMYCGQVLQFFPLHFTFHARLVLLSQLKLCVDQNPFRIVVYLKSTISSHSASQRTIV